MSRHPRNPLVESVEELQNAVRTIERWENARRRSERLDNVAELVSHQYDKASAYAQLIIAGGYAAFFASWTTLGAGEYPRLWALSALCTLSSAIVFIAWEVFKMTHTSILLQRIVPLLNAEPLRQDENLERIQGVMREHHLWLIRLWKPVLWGSIGPGILGAAVLITLFVIRITAG